MTSVDRLDPQLESLERTMDKDSAKLRRLGIPWGPEHVEAVKVASLKLAEVGAYPVSYYLQLVPSLFGS